MLLFEVVRIKNSWIYCVMKKWWSLYLKRCLINTSHESRARRQKFTSSETKNHLLEVIIITKVIMTSCVNDHYFWLVSLNFLCDLSLKFVFNKDSCIFENALIFIINRFSSMFFLKNRLRRRFFQFRWDIWIITARLSQENIWIFWSSIRKCLKTLLNSFHVYLFTFFFEARRTSNISTMYDALFIFKLCTNILRTQSILFCENNCEFNFNLCTWRSMTTSMQIELMRWVVFIYDVARCYINVLITVNHVMTLATLSVLTLESLWKVENHRFLINLFQNSHSTRLFHSTLA
jgi:hypothetical protein